MNIEKMLEEKCGKSIGECDVRELYRALSAITREEAEKRKAPDEGKKLYYISAEFLLGKLLVGDLINLGIYDEVKRVLEKFGKSLEDTEKEETEPSLGNGGLGRLAACYMNSAAGLGLNVAGAGLLYHFGLFRQSFSKNMQKEYPDRWMTEENMPIKTDKIYEVRLGNKLVKARLYKLPITGYKKETRYLYLFDEEGVSEELVGEGISFDKRAVEKNITLFLYPDDSDEDGQKLRIYQEYFMASAAAQMILEECENKGCRLYDLDRYAVIQINDTHPAMIIPELIRLLKMRGLDEDEAVETVRRTCAYTNHTILSEALEKWPTEYLREAVPELIPILEMLDRRVKEKFSDKSVWIFDAENRVRMANIAIHFGFCINGVAHLHTEILKNEELNCFYKIYPEKFKNITNGISFGRWLIKCNPMLCEFLEELLGDGFKTDARELEGLQKFKNDSAVLEKLAKIKEYNKTKAAEYIMEHSGITTDCEYIFDIQAKRLHEYKRQQLNLLYVIDKYLKIKAGILPERPIAAIFGAKAAPAYTTAKDIIHLALCLSEMIEKDAAARKYLKVAVVENYNVTAAEALVPACDISEQISLASKEASGTGNMKFMLNGAVTLGTEDGANVEIHELVGDENIYIFGASSKEVLKLYADGGYHPREIYENNPELKAAADFIDGGVLLKYGSGERLSRLKNELINKDYFMTFLDFDSYKKTKECMAADYLNRSEWSRKSIVNISKAGYFSADRAVSEYAADIWRI